MPGWIPLALALAAFGCAKQESSSTTSGTTSGTTTGSTDTTAVPVGTHAVTPAFAGKVWRVTESSAVAPGTTYDFRSDGTLVVSSPNATPLEGKWTWDAGSLTMIEEGISYPTDILALDDSTFRIRSNNPGEPVLITLVLDKP